MKNLSLKTSVIQIVFLLIFTLVPLSYSLALQQGTGGNTSQQNTGGNSIQQNTGGNSIQQNTGGSYGLENPLSKDNQTLIGLLQNLLDIIMVFAVPLIVFMIIYAGFLFVMDRGTGKNLDKAKRALLYSVIGGVLILGANIILYVIEGTVNAFR